MAQAHKLEHIALKKKHSVEKKNMKKEHTKHM